MLQHILCLPFTGGPLWPTHGTQGLPIRPAGLEGGTRSHMCLRKGSGGAMGPWKSLGGSEELTSVLLGKEGEQAIPDVVEGACFTFCPHPIAVPGSPQLCGFSCRAIRRAGTWAISAPQSRRCQARWWGLQKRTNPHAECGEGENAGGAWFGPRGILVSRWVAEVGWMHHM